MNLRASVLRLLQFLGDGIEVVLELIALLRLLGTSNSNSSSQSDRTTMHAYRVQNRKIIYHIPQCTAKD